MKHYKGSPEPSCRNVQIPKEILVTQLSQNILYILSTYGKIIPYKKWKPQDIGYLNEQEYNLALLLAMTEYNQYNEKIFNKLTLRNKI